MLKLLSWAFSFPKSDIDPILEFQDLKTKYTQNASSLTQILVGTILDIASINRIFISLIKRQPDKIKTYLKLLFS